MNSRISELETKLDNLLKEYQDQPLEDIADVL